MIGNHPWSCLLIYATLLGQVKWVRSALISWLLWRGYGEQGSNRLRRSLGTIFFSCSANADVCFFLLGWKKQACWQFSPPQKAAIPPCTLGICCSTPVAMPPLPALLEKGCLARALQPPPSLAKKSKELTGRSGSELNVWADDQH